jgi:PKD repeat protein
MTNRKIFRFVGLTLLLLTLVSAPISVAAPPASEPGGAPFVEGEVLLQVRPGVSAAEIARTVGGAVLRSIGNGGIYLLKVREGNVPAAVQALQGRQGVVFAEPNWLRELHGPNDPGYGLKWDLNNTGSLCDGADCAVADADMDWEEAYAHLGSNFSGSAVVAVIDTGIDAGHPDLNSKIVAGWDFLEGDSIPNDTYGHGTHVAGIALAETNNSTGTAGVGFSPNIKVMPLRVCDENGCPSDAVANAIYYAADHGANVINMSLGGRWPSSAEQVAIDYAWGKGLVIAASSGNDGSTSVSYPAAFPNCIAVGSTNWHDTLAGYSNEGTALDVVAPGGEMSALHDPEGIYSTMPTYSVYLYTRYGYSLNYDQLQGTSMAAPQVSGLAGLLFAMGVTSNVEVRQIIESTVDDLGAAGWDSSYGWGRINVYNAVQAAGGGGNQPPVAAFTYDCTDLACDFDASGSSDPDGSIASYAWNFGDGGTASGVTASYTYASGDTYTVSLTVTDNEGATDTETKSVTVSAGGGGTMHVSAITMWYTRAGKNYVVYTKVTIVDQAGALVQSATVSLKRTLPSGSTSTASGTTLADGTVTFSVKSKLTGTYTSTVTDVTHATLIYEPLDNVVTTKTLPVP